MKPMIAATMYDICNDDGYTCRESIRTRRSDLFLKSASGETLQESASTYQTKRMGN